MYFVGISTTWQRTVVVNDLVQGEVNRAKRLYEGCSGKHINCVKMANVLSHFKRSDIAATGIALVTGNDQRVVHELKGKDFSLLDLTESIQQNETSEPQKIRDMGVSRLPPCRVATTIIDVSTRQVTEIPEEYLGIDERTYNKFIAHFAYTLESGGAFPPPVFLGICGNLPPDADAELYASLMKCARNHDSVRILVDSSKSPLMHCLPYSVDVVKLNLSELVSTIKIENAECVPKAKSSIEEYSNTDIYRMMDILMDKGAQNVIVTRGGQSTLITLQQKTKNRVEICFSIPSSIEVCLINPIGSGDAVTAGIAFEIVNGHRMNRLFEESIVQGVITGTKCGVAQMLSERSGSLEEKHLTNVAKNVDISVVVS